MQNTNKIIQGTYSDYKIVKTRNVAQIIIEIPLETADTFCHMFGMPKPSHEKMVAVAMLNEQTVGQNKNVVYAIQKCALLCKEPIFGIFLQETKNMQEIILSDEKSIVGALRTVLGIKSRTEFHNPIILKSWNNLLNEYENWLLARNK